MLNHALDGLGTPAKLGPSITAPGIAARTICARIISRYWACDRPQNKMFGSFHMSHRTSEPVMPLAFASLMIWFKNVVYSVQLPPSPGQRGTLHGPSEPHSADTSMLYFAPSDLALA